MRCTGFEKSGGKVTEVHAEFRLLEKGEKPPKVPLFSQPLPLLLLSCDCNLKS